MKQFKTPLAIKGTKEELEDLVEPLKALGYTQWNHRCYSHFHYLLTCFSKENNLIGFNEDKGKPDIFRIEVPASNKELVLALAAMVEGNKPNIGEYVIGIESNILKNGVPLKITSVDSYKNAFSVDGRPSGGTASMHQTILGYTRKATTEEIINHFKQKDMKEKKIIGYKIIKQYHGMDKRFLGNIIQPPLYKFSDGKTMFPGACFDEKSPYYNSSFINEFLETVYEEEKKIIKVAHCDGVLDVEIKDNLAVCMDTTWSKSELELIISSSFSFKGKFVPESFTAGCNGQYKNISRKDIQKVIDALRD